MLVEFTEDCLLGARFELKNDLISDARKCMKDVLHYLQQDKVKNPLQTIFGIFYEFKNSQVLFTHASCETVYVVADVALVSEMETEKILQAIFTHISGLVGYLEAKNDVRFHGISTLTITSFGKKTMNQKVFEITGLCDLEKHMLLSKLWLHRP